MNTSRYTSRLALCSAGAVVSAVIDSADRDRVVFVFVDRKEAERQALKLNNTHRLLELAAN